MSLLLRSENLEKAACSDNKAGSRLGRVLQPSWGRHTRAHTCTKGNHCPQIVRHMLGACGGQNLTIERAVADTSAPLTCPAAPNIEAESPAPQESCQHFNNSGWSPSCFCALTSPSQIENSSILDPSLQLSCKDNSHGLVTFPYNVCS